MKSIYEELQISKPLGSPQRELSVALLLTAERLRDVINRLCRQFDLTLQQYNMLRILKASYPSALSCSEINCRMIQRAPDITRLIGRLENHGYVERRKDEHDQRVVRTMIRREGIDLIEGVEKKLAAFDSLFDCVNEEERSGILCVLGSIRREADRMLARNGCNGISQNGSNHNGANNGLNGPC